MQNNKCYTFLVTNCKKVGETKFDTTEDIITYIKPIREIPELVAEGKITHSLVVAAFYWYYLYKEAQAKN
jgi:hypothetical protein